MIITTIQDVPGMEIVEYRGLATGEVVIGAGLRNLFGERIKEYEDEIIQARSEVLKELEARATEMSANAVIGVRINFDSLGGNGNNMLLVTATGTAVVVK